MAHHPQSCRRHRHGRRRHRLCRICTVVTGLQGASSHGQLPRHSCLRWRLSTLVRRRGNGHRRPQGRLARFLAYRRSPADFFRAMVHARRQGVDIVYLRPCQPTECPAVRVSVVVDVGTEKCPGAKQIGLSLQMSSSSSQQLSQPRRSRFPKEKFR